MIYSSTDILDHLNDTIIIEPFNESQLNPNSYDVRLGNWFYLLRWVAGKPHYYGPIRVLDGQPLVLPKGETVLAHTKEIVGGEYDVTTQIRAKSSTRRKGISICDDAGLGDIGYVDHWTMELTANSNYAVVKPNMRIAQVVFHMVMSPLERNQDYEGQYRRELPQNMVPRRCEPEIIPVPEDYHPHILSDLAESIDRMGEDVFAVKNEVRY